MDRELPRPDEIWRHFKNKLYCIIAIARHTETDERLVVYQAMYGIMGFMPYRWICLRVKWIIRNILMLNKSTDSCELNEHT